MGEQGPTFTVFRKRGDVRGSLFLSNQSYVKLRPARPPGCLDSQRGSAVWGLPSRERVRRAGNTVLPDWIWTVFPTVLRRTGPEDLLRRARTTVGLRAFPWRADLQTLFLAEVSDPIDRIDRAGLPFQLPMRYGGGASSG